MTSCIRALLAGVALLPITTATASVAAAPAIAGTPEAAAGVQAQRPGGERDFAIAAGPLDAALIQFGAQADLQILYAAERVTGLTTPGLRGRFAVAEALERLLAGSGLVWTESRPGVLVLRAEDDPRAQAEAVALEDVIVTGTLIRGVGRTPSPVVTLTAADLDRRGQGSVAEALSDLPQTFGGAATPITYLTASDAGGSNTTLSTGVDLRGLGPDATLVLVDGRRLAGTGSRGEFADVSALPNAAVERIDVLLDGASALYGSDAVGGVVNIILKRDFDGQESRARVGAARGGAEEVMLSHLIGRRWGAGAALVSYEYRDQGSLSGSDRRYTATGDLRPFGGDDARNIFAAPGNLVHFDPVQSGYVADYAIRPLSGGVARTPADFAAGAANLANGREGADILPSQTRHSIFARIRQAMGERLELSADLRFSRREFGFAGLAPSEILTVTAANPGFVSPTGAAFHQIAYSFGGDLAPQRTEGLSRSLGVTAGLDLALAGDWTFNAYGAWAEEFSRVHTPRLQYSHLYEALGLLPDDPGTAYSAARDGYFNPFGSGGANSDALGAFIGAGYSDVRNRSRVASANGLVEGTLRRLPGGDLKLAVGAQARRETFRRANEDFVQGATPAVAAIAPQIRDIGAVFAEARIPLVGPDNARPGVRRLELSLAGRIEHYEDFGSSTNPKLGVLWSPRDPLTLRASWGTSFRAPSLNELNEAVVIGATSTTENGVERLAVIRLGGNPDLGPETAETVTVGFDYVRPRSWRLSASLFDTRFQDRIGRPIAENVDNALVDPNLAAFVTRVDPSVAADLAAINALITDPRFVPPGLYPPTAYSAIFDARWLNTGELHVRGLDLAAGWGFDLGADRIDLDASAAWLFDYSRKLTPVASREDLLDVAGYPADLRLQAGVGWIHGAWAARLGISHVDGYRDPRGPAIDAWTTADVQLAWSPEAVLGVSGLDLALNIHNLFDAEPPFYNSPSGDGYDARQADPLGRTVSLQLTRRW